MVSDNIIDLLIKWMFYICYKPFSGILPHMGPALGAPKVEKMRFMENPKWPPVPIECITEKSLENKKV